MYFKPIVSIPEKPHYFLKWLNFNKVPHHSEGLPSPTEIYTWVKWAKAQWNQQASKFNGSSKSYFNESSLFALTLKCKSLLGMDLFKLFISEIYSKIANLKCFLEEKSFIIWKWVGQGYISVVSSLLIHLSLTHHTSDPKQPVSCT